MTKKHRKPTSVGGRPEADGAPPDPLGELTSRHHVSLVGVLVVSGAIALVGFALVGLGLASFAFIRWAISLTFLLIGTAVLLAAVALLVANVFNIGRRLEVRKGGIRFVQAGV